MAKTTPRLCVDQHLQAEVSITLNRDQGHYLTGVLRMQAGDPVKVFNGRDGEWLAIIAQVSKKALSIKCERRTSDVKQPPDIDFVFAPVKHARLDYVVQKATELGARRLRPVFTARTVAERVNTDRMKANAIEAAEQCNLVFVPEVAEPQKLEKLLTQWEKSRSLIYCDETALIVSPLEALRSLSLPAAILVGPEGGFTEGERQMLKSLPFVTPVSLGPRIMRADTAGVAIMALVQSVLGDWGKA